MRRIEEEERKAAELERQRIEAERLEAVTALLQTFVAPEEGEEDEDEIADSLRRELAARDGDAPGHLRLSRRFIAGVILLDIVGYSWQNQDLAAGQDNYLHVSTFIYSINKSAF